MEGGAGGFAEAQGVARDGAAALQPLQSRLYRGPGEAEFAGEIGDGLAGIPLEGRNQSAICVVYLWCHVVIVPKVSVILGGLPR